MEEAIIFLVMRGEPLLEASSVGRLLLSQANFGNPPSTPSKLKHEKSTKRKAVRFEDMGKYIGWVFDYSSLIFIVNAGTQPSFSSQLQKAEAALPERLSQRKLSA